MCGGPWKHNGQKPSGPEIANWITEAVAHHYSIPPAAIRGPLRRRNLTGARFITIGLSKHWTGANISELGRWFKRDRTAIRNAIAAALRPPLLEEAKSILATLSELKALAPCRNALEELAS